MDTKWTFFISSTLEDLRAERQAVANQVLKMEEIPIGMEQFGAIDKSAWDNIEKFIDTADYYILIIAGKYGSIDESAGGISFTEREYRYAKSKGIPVIAVLHGDPDNLPAKLSEQSPEIRAKLDAFRQEVKSARLVAFYKDSAELIGEVSAAIGKAKQRFPRPGWVRSNRKSNDIQADAVRLETELASANAELRRLHARANTRPSSSADDYSGLTYVNIKSRLYADGRLNASYTHHGSVKQIEVNLKWKNIFMRVAQELFDDTYMPYNLGPALMSLANDYITQEAGNDIPDAGSMHIASESVENVQLVLESFTLIYRGDMTGWFLTKLGRKLYIDHRAEKIVPDRNRLFSRIYGDEED